MIWREKDLIIFGHYFENPAVVAVIQIWLESRKVKKGATERQTFTMMNKIE